jgi:hypothetical protein
MEKSRLENPAPASSNRPVQGVQTQNQDESIVQGENVAS